MRGSAAGETCRRTGGRRCRVSTACSTASSRSSVSSRSMETSASRVMRKRAVASTCAPGKSPPTLAAITSSRRARRTSSPGRRTQREICCGTGVTAIRGSPSALVSTAATCHCSPGNRGAGCSSWTASGVSTGRTSLLKYVCRNVRCWSVHCAAGATLMPAEASCARAAKTPACCSSSMRWTRWPTARNCAAGVMPHGSRRRTPSARALIKPATRTRKNSSRLELTMARNLMRSNSGRSSARPWRSTRSLNSNQLNSRLKYMSWDRSGSLLIKTQPRISLG